MVVSPLVDSKAPFSSLPMAHAFSRSLFSNVLPAGIAVKDVVGGEKERQQAGQVGVACCVLRPEPL